MRWLPCVDKHMGMPCVHMNMDIDMFMAWAGADADTWVDGALYRVAQSAATVDRHGQSSV